MADLARQMFRDCTYDLKEISQCRDCYRFATENPSKYWYCKPCRPFHDLVYARQKGCSFWPAKVIRVTNGDSYDVRFFGGYHQRAVVDKASIRPITVSVGSLGVKRSSLWNKACDELKKHQEFVSKVKSTMPDFLQDCYGDPFTSSPDILEFANSLEESDNEGEEGEGALDEAAKEELEQIKSALEEEDGSSKLFSQTSVPPGPPIGVDNEGSPAKKKRRGRPPSNKHKKEALNETTVNGLEENMVSSSSQEPRVASIAVQTPSKLLKDLVQGSGKISKDELRQLKEKVCFLILLKMDRKIRTIVIFQIRREVEADKDQEKKRAVNVATRSLERDLERLKADHATEIEQLNERHKQETSELKRKQWVNLLFELVFRFQRKAFLFYFQCYNCEAEAIYWCCWNTAYCTTVCQQEHWKREHKRNCRRTR